MPTTTSATSSSSPPSPTNASATTGPSSSTQSILTALGAGSGIDTVNLVKSLVAAQFDPKTQALATQNDTAAAQLTEVTKVKSAINDFSLALHQLVTGGTLAAQPFVSTPGVLTATALTGAKLDGLSASIEVMQLATAQVATTATLGKRTDTIGTGTLTLTFGTATTSNGAMTEFSADGAAPVQIAIDSAHNTLDGIAGAINAARTGVTATVVTDVDGSARLSFKGPTGAAEAFTLSGDSASLSGLAIGPGQSATTLGSSAGNARLSLDGVSVERASNSVSDLVTGVRLDLASARPGQPVTLGSTIPTASLATAVTNVVDTYNQIQSELSADLKSAGGSLFGDPAAASLQRQLQALTLTPLTASAGTGAPTTLADLGVATVRDGTLKVDSTQLSKTLSAWPGAVEAMFADGVRTSGDGLGAALAAINSAANSFTYGLGASITKYTQAQSDIAKQQAALTDQEITYKTQLTQQYASMDAKVAAYKSTQAFLTAQIAAWNPKSN